MSKIFFFIFNSKLLSNVFIFSIVIIGITDTTAQNMSNSIMVQLNDDLTTYKQQNPTEKIYLHINKSRVFPGDILYYSIYNSLGLRGGEKNSKIVYVDLLDENNEILVSKTHILEFGRGSGSIDIKKDLTLGAYTLRAYTKWMRNYSNAFFYYTKIDVLGNEVDLEPVDIISEKIDFQFFPEGGNAIVGLNNKIAFRAVGPDGYSRAVEGWVVNSKGDRIVPIMSLDNGSGFFYLTPKAGESYYAKLNDNSSNRLLKIRETGYNMQVDNMDDNKIKIIVQASEEFLDNDFYLLGVMHQNILYQDKFKLTSENRVLQIEIPKSQLPTGVMTLTLFDEDKKPVVERPIFINNKQDLIIKTTIDKTTFNKRDRIQIDISTTDKKGNPVVADLSLFVNDMDILKKNKLSSNILSYFLLESDIRGYIDRPMSYLKDNSYKTKAKLDLLMLTHGWRKILWSNDRQIKNKNLYELENSSNYSVSGKAVNRNNKPLPFITIKMVAESKNGINFYEGKTNNLGRFTIKNIVEKEEVKMSFRGYRNNNNDAINIDVILDETERDKLSSAIRIPKEPLLIKPISNNSIIEKQKLKEINPKYYSMLNGVLLDEVNLNAKIKKKKPRKAESMYGLTPDAVIYPDADLFTGDALMQLNQVPGVQVISWVDGLGVPRKKIKIRNATSFNLDANPLIVLDNVILGGDISDIMNQIQSINSLDIERFEVLKGPSAIFGARGANGVILIYTKGGILNKKRTESSIYEFSKYDVSREFYSPNYKVKSIENQIPDYRSALYWSPSIVTDKYGKASVSFFNSDLAKKIQVSIEGYSANGAIGYHLKSYGELENVGTN